jgi:glutamate formiminotransferase/formiminotetrahydrofolate cyclodeaminase
MAAILQTIQGVAGIRVLDRHSDLDHNRTVVTFVGDPAEVETAAFQAIARAAELIDLEHHTGAHPRIGATDVVPFVPLHDITMAECVALARRLGARVGAELGIPVYLYEEAATRPERQNLENIRRGQYETLKTEIATRPERAPDFGPARLSGAGATVIGARQPLIAFNIYLSTSDVRIARRIATAVRHSSGGLHFVKAIGVRVGGLAQVSMNLTNFIKTPLARVVELVRLEAKHYGTRIERSELIGLIPQKALVDAAAWYLQLEGLSEEQVLETRLAESLPVSPAPGTDFLEALASGTPVPGGGAAAAHTAATAAALVEMVARISLVKQNSSGAPDRLRYLIEAAGKLRAHLSAAAGTHAGAVVGADAGADATAYEAVLRARRLPHLLPTDQAARRAAVAAALVGATQIQLEVARQALAVLQLAQEASRLGIPGARPDALAGADLALAALRSAIRNVRANSDLYYAAGALADGGEMPGLLAKAPASDASGSMSEFLTEAADIERQASQLAAIQEP